jgi:hypothetical protein
MPTTGMDKRRINIFTITIILFLVLIFLCYHYLINIYEVRVITEPEALYADNQSTVVVSVVPLNSFGWKALFRTVTAEFEIKEGASLVETVKVDTKNGKLFLRAKDETGKVTILVKSEYSLLPTIVEIPVYPNYT